MVSIGLLIAMIITSILLGFTLGLWYTHSKVNMMRKLNITNLQDFTQTIITHSREENEKMAKDLINEIEENTKKKLNLIITPEILKIERPKYIGGTFYQVILDKNTEKVIGIKRKEVDHEFKLKKCNNFYTFDGNKKKFDESKYSIYNFVSKLSYDNEMVEKIFAKIIEEGHTLQNLEYIYKVKFINEDSKF